jgi:RNA polymerase sigma-70 factor (ECF subfamily)
LRESYSYTDKELVDLLKKNSSFAFQILFDKYSQKIYRFSLSYLKNKEEAEEIVQEVFLKIWKVREELSSGKSFDSFLFVIARNAILNTIRKEKSKQVFLDYVLLNPDRNALLEEELNFNELERFYKVAVDQLSPRRKEIYLLSREEALSNAEIAARLGISVKTVENQMTSALSDIKKKFRSLGFSGLFFFEIFL